jgi:hypothetical protein
MPGAPVLKTDVGYQSDNRRSANPRPVREPSSFIQGKVALALWFVAAFGASYALVVACGALLVGKDNTVALDSEDGARDSVVPDALVVSHGGTALRVSHSPALNPTGDGDFLLYVWFKLRKPLSDGERAVFVAKYDADSKTRPGYSVGLVGGPDGVRPNVYWQNEEGHGRWYPFASTQLRAKEWYLLGISFREKRYLGVHLMPHNGGKKAEVLGGYDLEPQVIPDTPADLVVGAFGASKFRGRIGPFGVIRREGMTKDVANFIVQMSKNAGSLPSAVSRSEAVLVASPKEDSGAFKLSIQQSSAGSATQAREQDAERE